MYLFEYRVVHLRGADEVKAVVLLLRVALGRFRSLELPEKAPFQGIESRDHPVVVVGYRRVPGGYAFHCGVPGVQRHVLNEKICEPQTIEYEKVFNSYYLYFIIKSTIWTE